MKHHQEANIASRLLNRKPLILLLILAICEVMILTACSSEPEKVVERENIFVEPETISFNKETNLLNFSLKTNLPPETVVIVTLHRPEEKYWKVQPDLIVNEGGQIIASVSPPENPINGEMEKTMNGEILFQLTLPVNRVGEDVSKHENPDFLNDTRVGGLSSDLEWQYEDSKEVEVLPQKNYPDFNYLLKVSATKPILLEDGYIAEQNEAETKNETSVDSISNTAVSNYSTATGADWAKYSFDQKFIAVETILQSLKASGKTITADTYWFIDALNAYYGNGTEPGDAEKIVSMILLSGIAGGVIK